jgi:AraC-like DNA-binding protein
MDGVWDDLTGRLQRERTGNTVAIDGALRQLLAVFIDSAQLETEHIEGAARFHEVLGYIEANLTGRCTLSELADVANLHPTYFSTTFTRTMGENPTTYVNRRRIEWAKRLLRDTRAPLQEVASTVGFCDAYYFSRIFKRLTGITPGQFRNQPVEFHP